MDLQIPLFFLRIYLLEPKIKVCLLKNPQKYSKAAIVTPFKNIYVMKFIEFQPLLKNKSPFFQFCLQVWLC